MSDIKRIPVDTVGHLTFYIEQYLESKTCIVVVSGDGPTDTYMCGESKDGGLATTPHIMDATNYEDRKTSLRMIDTYKAILSNTFVYS